MDAFGSTLESTMLVPGGPGQFDVEVDGRQVFSKYDVQRHAEPGEVVDIIAREQQPANGDREGRVYPAGG